MKKALTIIAFSMLLLTMGPILGVTLSDETIVPKLDTKILTCKKLCNYLSQQKLLELDINDCATKCNYEPIKVINFSEKILNDILEQESKHYSKLKEFTIKLKFLLEEETNSKN